MILRSSRDEIIEMKNIIGQQLIIGLEGHSLKKEESDFIVKNNIGGVILFKRNIESPKQLHALTTELNSLRSQTADKAPLFISIDMEGGRVHRLPPPFTQWPPLAQLGKIDSTSVAFKFAYAMGLELRSVGINLNFAPSVDVLTNPENKVIGDRSISHNPEEVAKIASAVVRGYIKAEVIPVAKHFPGHGNTLLDSHEHLPIEERTLAELEACELIPFKKVIRARLDMLMSSHIKFPKIDPDFPVTLSHKFITEILKQQLRYKNLVITDDLGMKALTNHYDLKSIVLGALNAGCHILLFCNEFDSPAKAFEIIEKAAADKSISQEMLRENHKMIMNLKKDFLTANTTDVQNMSRTVGHPDHIKLAKAIHEGSVPEELLA